MKRRSGDTGITLLELLISLSIMAMIAVGLSSLFDAGGRVWSRLDQETAFADDAVNRSNVRRQLENMPVVSADERLDRLFRQSTAGFVAQLVRQGEPLWLEVAMSETDLVARTPDSNAILRRNISRTEFSYYGRKTVDVAPDWYPDWQEATILPALVKIETWRADGVVNPPLTIQLAKQTRQMEISLSSLVPPAWPSPP